MMDEQENGGIASDIDDRILRVAALLEAELRTLTCRYRLAGVFYRRCIL